MKLDYSPPNFRFIVGTLDVTPIAFDWSIHSKALEINTDGCWQGSFTIRTGMTGRDYASFPDSLLDPLTSPSFWRPSQSPVKISVEFNGVYYNLPVMRIDKYIWNPKTREGQGQLIQFVESVNATRPATTPESKAGTATVELLNATRDEATTPELKIGQQLGLKEIIEILIVDAQKESPQKRPYAISGITGQLDSSMTTRNPIADVQKLCGVNWQWLTVDNTETIKTVSGTPEDYPILFSRSIDQVEWEPDIQNINFAATKVIVTGSRQVAEAPCVCDVKPDHNKRVDSKGRTKSLYKEEKKPYREVYATSKSLYETVAEKTTVMYKYLDKSFTGGTVEYMDFYDFNVSTLSYDIGVFTDKSNAITCKDFDEMTPIATVTVKEWPAGRISSKFGTNEVFYPAEVIVEGPTIKGRLVPVGLVKPEDPQNLNLIWVSKEELITDRNQGKCGPVDPRTGKASCITTPPIQESAQPGPEIPLKTEVIKAEASVTYNGWAPLIKSPHIEEVGFIPSQAHGDKMAMSIARREERRRNAVQVSMPIRGLPEYFIAGCPIVGRARVYDGEFGFEAVIISMERENAEISFSFGRINQFSPPVPSPIALAPYIPGPGLQLIVPTTSISLQTGTVNYIQVAAGGGIS